MTLRLVAVEAQQTPYPVFRRHHFLLAFERRADGTANQVVILDR
ncbi:MAG TPA: hypothetical protein VGB76_16965 [Pyrinomonadaceae bacterium]